MKKIIIVLSFLIFSSCARIAVVNSVSDRKYTLDGTFVTITYQFNNGLTETRRIALGTKPIKPGYHVKVTKKRVIYKDKNKK